MSNILVPYFQKNNDIDMTTNEERVWFESPFAKLTYIVMSK